jgi:hypothetical protein
MTTETPEAIADWIFAQAEGDHSKAINLFWKMDRPRDVAIFLDKKFQAAAVAAAPKVRAEAGDNRVRAYQLSKDFNGLRTRYLESAVRDIYRDEDKATADGIVEACYDEAGGDHRLGYQIAIETAGDNEFIRNRVTTKLRERFVADTAERLAAEGKPPIGKRRMWHKGSYSGPLFGIERDGTWVVPSSMSEADVRAEVYRAVATDIEVRTEAAVRAGKTRTRRHEKRLAEITEGLRSGKVYGPAYACVCCSKSLSDDESIRRGIGSECWVRILKRLEREAF